jgi:hypothetical protein
VGWKDNIGSEALDVMLHISVFVSALNGTFCYVESFVLHQCCICLIYIMAQKLVKLLVKSALKYV